MAGYSETSLIKKLGVKEGYKIAIINAPENYFNLLGNLPRGITVADGKEYGLNLIHFFTREVKELKITLPLLLDQIVSDGTIWISWYKKTSGIITDVTENRIREIALPIGLVDVKVCAVDENWSGLKLVIRKKWR